jgi:hypothetical protein
MTTAASRSFAVIGEIAVACAPPGLADTASAWAVTTTM